MITSSRRRVGWAAVLLPLVVSACTTTGSGEGPAADCAAVVEYDGHTYLGHGDLRRTPDLTGRTMPAVRPGCDDSGGQAPPEPADEVEVQELADIGAGTAVLLDDGIYVREGRSLPDRVAHWFASPRCQTLGAFEITADWLGITSRHEPRFDGDVRAPYRLSVRVTEGPGPYVGTTIRVRGTADTTPGLSRDDVATSLWEGGYVEATVVCEDGSFVASSLTAHPPADPGR